MANIKKKMDLLTEARKLKIQQELLEKHTSSLLNNLNTLFEYDDVKISTEEIEKRRQYEKSKFDAELTSIQNSLRQLEHSKDKDVQHLKSFLVDINGSVMAIKEANESGLQTLTEEEKAYVKDLEILEKRIDDFLKVNTVKGACVSMWKPPIKSKLNSKIAEIVGATGTNKEVEAFQRFLQTSGGHTGGWDGQDHQLYLQHRSKLKGPNMADALHILLPDIPLEAIAEHEEWYKQYESLRDNQKLAIKKWRESTRKRGVETKTTVENNNVREVKANPAMLKELEEKKKQRILEWKT